MLTCLLSGLLLSRHRVIWPELVCQKKHNEKQSIPTEIQRERDSDRDRDSEKNRKREKKREIERERQREGERNGPG